MKLPRIEPTEEESLRMTALRALSQGLTRAFHEEGVTAALKGGTALALFYGLSRPSTDIDWEGDTRVDLKQTLRKAMAHIPQWKLRRIGSDWMRRGTRKITLQERHTGRVAETAIDYRVMGTMPSMARQVPRQQLAISDGIQTYNIKTLAQRKLQTIIGERPRKRARDWYDAAWLMQRHPDVVGAKTAQQVLEALNNLPKSAVRKIEREATKDRIMSRIAFEIVVENIKTGVETVHQASTARAMPDSLKWRIDPQNNERRLKQPAKNLTQASAKKKPDTKRPCERD